MTLSIFFNGFYLKSYGSKPEDKWPWIRLITLIPRNFSPDKPASAWDPQNRLGGIGKRRQIQQIGDIQ